MSKNLSYQEQREINEYYSQIIISSQLSIFDAVEKAITSKDHVYLKMNEYKFLLNNLEIEGFVNG